MRFLASSACLLVTLGMAAPASAGFAASRHYGSVPVPRAPVFVEVPSAPMVRWGADEVRERIHDAREAGAISRSEARQLKREAAVLSGHAELYGRDGLSDSERHELDTRALYLMDAANPPPPPAAGPGQAFE